MQHLLTDYPANTTNGQMKPKRKYTMRKRMDEQGRVEIGDSHHLVSIEMIDDIIKMSEEKIIQFKQQQSELQPELNHHKKEHQEALEIYEQAKGGLDKVQARYDEIELLISKKKNIITLQNHIKTGKPLEKLDFRENVSNTTVKAKGVLKNKRINWIGACCNHLQRIGRFMAPVDLIQEVLKTDVIVKEQFRNLTKNDIGAIHRNANQLIVAANTTNKRQGNRLVEYNGKIGLIEWLDNGTIKPQYLKEFMG